MGAVDDELILVFVLDQASSNELLHHISGQMTRLDVFLQLHDLLLQGMDLGIFCVFSRLSFISSLFLGFDLGLGSSPHAGCL